MKGIAAVLTVSGVLFVGTASAWSAEQTVTLGVDMFCPTCPYIVKRSLERVDGVLDVDVSFAEQIAVVRYDDNRTNVGVLTQATANVGFPSQPLLTN